MFRRPTGVRSGQHLLKLGLGFGDLLVIDGVLKATLLLVNLLVLGQFLPLSIQLS